jgi:hypothetical protein
MAWGRSRARSRRFGGLLRTGVRYVAGLFRKRRGVTRKRLYKRRPVIKGRGGYVLGASQASALLKSQENAVPMMHSNSQSIVVRHREFITSIYSNMPEARRYVGAPVTNLVGGGTCIQTSATYANSIQSFRINPGVGIGQNGANVVIKNTAPNTPVNLPGPTAAPADQTFIPAPAYANGGPPAASGTAPAMRYGFQLQGMFPWLSKIAQNFEQYRIKGLVFQYIPSSADTSSEKLTTGSVDFFIEYNTASSLTSGTYDPDTGLFPGNGLGFPGQQTLLLNNMWAQSVKPCNGAFIPFESAKRAHSNELLYVNPNVLSVPVRPEIEPLSVTLHGSDMRMYDAGTLYVVAYGQTNDQVLLGQLWCSYEIELIKPQLTVRE